MSQTTSGMEAKTDAGLSGPRGWGEHVTLQEFLDSLRQVWRPVLLGGILAIPIGVLVGTLRPKRYVAHAAFMAEQTSLSSLPSGLGALAAQFGVNLANEGTRSPQFYSDLLGTTALLTSLLDSTVDSTQPLGGTVRVLLIGTNDNSRQSTDRSLRKLRRRVHATADSRTSVVQLSVSAETPRVAERMAGALLEEVKHFNVSTRQLLARERRVFLEGRVTDAYHALSASEEALRRFYEGNRRFSESPALVFDESRMKRGIELRQELYTTLSKELETARIQEINDTPTITVIDPPTASSRPSGPTVIGLAALFFILGVCSTTAWRLTSMKSRSIAGHPTGSRGN